MQKPAWHFPETIDEAVDLIAMEGILPHAGGTGLMRRGVRDLEGLVDLSGLKLDVAGIDGEVATFGSMLSFAEAARHMRGIDPESILVDALDALPRSLRNRITLGGSIALFPPWSDLVGPLVALDAEVLLEGKKRGTVKLEEALKDTSLKRGVLITGVRVPTTKWRGVYCRAERTCFDYATFNISFLLKKAEDGSIEDARVVVVGCKDKVKRLDELEAALKGERAGDVDVASVVESQPLEFRSKKSGSSDYLLHVARVELERGLAKLLER